MDTEPIPGALNHVAITMPADALELGWEDILAFFESVFGWTGTRRHAEPGGPLVVLLGPPGQFLYVEGDPGLGDDCVTRRRDHFGIRVESEAVLDAVLDRARRYQRRDPRVQIVEKHVTIEGDVEVVHCDVGFALPVVVEIQHFRSRTGSRIGP